MTYNKIAKIGENNIEKRKFNRTNNILFYSIK